MKNVKSKISSQNKKRVIKLLVIGMSILLGVNIPLGLIFSYFSPFILIYLTIVVSIVGYFGGIWLWENLSSSEKLKQQIQILIKRFGIITIIGLPGVIAALLIFTYIAEVPALIALIDFMNWLMVFLFAYNSGYFVALWKKPIHLSNRVDSGKLSKMGIYPEIIRKSLNLTIPTFIVIISASILFYLIKGDRMQLLTVLSLQLLLFFGFNLGYIVWEHLKTSNRIEGKFKKQLIWISLIFLIVSGGLLAYGFYFILSGVNSALILREILIYYTMFLVCIFFYFLGLYVSIKTVATEEKQN
ncbi:MAG: hypothetical protein ACTSRS_04870 [Candidatus Helarchaeota archaeon]